MNVKEKLQALLTASNNTTGETDTTLTDAVQSLIDGYGGGGAMPAPPGYELVTNEFDFVPTRDSNPNLEVEHGLGVRPAYIVIFPKDLAGILADNRQLLLVGFYGSCSGVILNEQNVDELGSSVGGYYKRSNNHNALAERANYYIKDATDTSFILGYTGAYVYPAGYSFHVACFGFKKVVA